MSLKGTFYMNSREGRAAVALLAVLAVIVGILAVYSAGDAPVSTATGGATDKLAGNPEEAVVTVDVRDTVGNVSSGEKMHSLVPYSPKSPLDSPVKRL